VAVEQLLIDAAAGQDDWQYPVAAPDEQYQGGYIGWDLEAALIQQPAVVVHLVAVGVEQRLQGCQLGVDAGLRGILLAGLQLVDGVDSHLQVDGLDRGAGIAHRQRALAPLTAGHLRLERAFERLGVILKDDRAAPRAGRVDGDDSAF
jgi:hypothetical protein